METSSPRNRYLFPRIFLWGVIIIAGLGIIQFLIAPANENYCFKEENENYCFKEVKNINEIQESADVKFLSRAKELVSYWAERMPQ